MKNNKYISIFLLNTVAALVLFAGGIAVLATTAHADESVYEQIRQELEDTENGTATSTPLSGFLRDGVYGCKGAQYGTVGLQGPTGAHVPTFDDAVHDQGRILTYKECLLDGVLIQMRETLVSYLISSVVKWANNGFNGQSVYITNNELHKLENVSDPFVEQYLSKTLNNSIAEPFKRNVITKIARDYAAKTRDYGSGLRCPLSNEELQACLNGNCSKEASRVMRSTPACNPLFATVLSEQKMQRGIETLEKQEDTYALWGDGVLPVRKNEEIDLGDGTSISIDRIVTPGFLISEQLKQVIGTGIRQTENADEIDEMISALMSNIGTEMLTGINGFSGLSRSVSGKTAYVDRVSSEAAARARNSMTGAGASILDNAIDTETEYREVRQSSAKTLTQTRLQLESWEYTCWGALIDQAAEDLSEGACNSANNNNNNNNGAFGMQNNTGNYCGASVSIVPATDRLKVRIDTTQAATITVRGQAITASTNITVTVSDTESNALETVTVQSGSDAAWNAGSFDLLTLNDGDITISATESSGSGTQTPVTAIVTKITDAAGDIELFAPVHDPTVTITANASGNNNNSYGVNVHTRSATLSPNITRSRSVASSQILSLLEVIKDSIARSVKALEVLVKLRAVLESTASVSAQRYILEKVDGLVAQQALHTQAQLRAAKEQQSDIENAMENLLSDTKESWEAGWCDPTNWNSYAL